MGGELREIVDVEQCSRAFVLLALLLPPIALLAGVILGKRRGQMRQYALFGLMFGLLGPLNWLLWRMYNAITDKIGLDSVANLGINLALFVLFGIVAGFGVAWVLRRFHSPSDTRSE